MVTLKKLRRHWLIAAVLSVIIILAVGLIWFEVMTNISNYSYLHKYNAHPEEAIYISANGDIVLPQNFHSINTLERNDNVYTLTGDLQWELIIDRSNIVFDGQGFSTGNGEGAYNYQTIGLSNVKNVTVQNVNIKGHYNAIGMTHTQNSTIDRVSGGTISISDSSSNIISNSVCSLSFNKSDNNTVINCTTTGYEFENSNYNSILNNICSGGGRSLEFIDSSNNLVFGTVFQKTYWWISIYGSSTHNTFVANNVTFFKHYYADSLQGTNYIYHNNFYNFSWNHTASTNSANIWSNDGQGNYWSDNASLDLDHNGIGDTPYVIDSKNSDGYPLIDPVDIRSQ